MNASRLRSLRSESGAGFFFVLMALLVVAVLYFGYFKMQQQGGERSTGIAAINNSRAFACRTNRQEIERQITAWEAEHDGEPPTLDALAAEFGRLPTCPEGGTYTLVGRKVKCSKHP
jgi:competence protein ComGC